MSNFFYHDNRLTTREGNLAGFFETFRIYNASHQFVGSIRVPWILDREGRRIAWFDKDKGVLNDRYHMPIGTMHEISRVIDGPKNIVLAALWLLIVR